MFPLFRNHASYHLWSVDTCSWVFPCAQCWAAKHLILVWIQKCAEIMVPLPKSHSTADLHWGQPPHISRSFQKMLMHPGFTFQILVLSFSLVYGNPAAVVLTPRPVAGTSLCLSVPMRILVALEKRRDEEMGGWKRVRSVPLPPKAGQVYGKYIYVSEGKQLGNWPGNRGTRLSEGSPSAWCQGYFYPLTDSCSGSNGETVLMAGPTTAARAPCQRSCPRPDLRQQG